MGIWRCNIDLVLDTFLDRQQRKIFQLKTSGIQNCFLVIK